MMRTPSWRLFTLLTVLALLLATSCSSGSSSLTAPSDSDESLQLVLYGDSILTFPEPHRGAIDAYTDMLEEDFGVPVYVDRPMSVYGLPSRVVDNLMSEGAQSKLAKADIVIIESPLSGIAFFVGTALGQVSLDMAPICEGDDQQQCMKDLLAEYKDSVEEMFSLLTEAVDPSEMLIRAVDGYQPFVADQLAADTLQVTNPYWQEAQEFFAETAARYGIPTARVFDEFMGPDGTDDPNDRGLIAPDKAHPSEAGAILIAELIYDLGYDFAD